MKKQNFCAYLDEKTIDAKNVLELCKEYEIISKEALDAFKPKLKINSSDIEKKINNMNKFTLFMRKEFEDYLEVLESEEFSDFLDSDLNLDDRFFEEIDLIPVYLEKNAGVLVLDLLESFFEIMQMKAIEIEGITGNKFPIDGDDLQTNLIKREFNNYKMSFTKKDTNEVFGLVLSYEDFNILTKMIKKQIKELVEPICR